ncbi:GNAT family N-acetyltransferase [Bradyrhizobium sp. NBAIM03]|uniref:GNAT family N-acetyltransferase n=1 Tax=Bradyrhizobium sp. NBAIM03 TaxID=2793816 RepID=UPI001CD68A67|nr:GNAT family N-acetyltransferase [Bradyrhizobium sp. NBAIM03]
MECSIRPALDDDAAAISAVILPTLRETNAKDYTAEIIARIEPSFGPDAVRRLIGQRTVFVATIGGRLVGTASLDGSVVRTVFVAPDVQARGIGKLLMAEIERTARERNNSVLDGPFIGHCRDLLCATGVQCRARQLLWGRTHDHHGAGAHRADLDLVHTMAIAAESPTRGGSSSSCGTHRRRTGASISPFLPVLISKHEA